MLFLPETTKNLSNWLLKNPFSISVILVILYITADITAVISAYIIAVALQTLGFE